MKFYSNKVLFQVDLQSPSAQGRCFLFHPRLWKFMADFSLFKPNAIPSASESLCGMFFSFIFFLNKEKVKKRLPSLLNLLGKRTPTSSVSLVGRSIVDINTFKNAQSQP